MNNINVLPSTVVQTLEEAGISHDSLIFYRNNRWVYQGGHSIPPTDELHSQPIDALGPFGIHEVDVTFVLYPDTFEYTITKIGHRELKDEDKATGVFAPIGEITLVASARSTANIPEDATHFCWLYPPHNIYNNDEMDLDHSYETNLLRIGGFAYFKFSQNTDIGLQLVRVNALSELADNGLTFEGPHPWKQEFTEQLWNQKRFQPITLSSLRQRGAQYFAFINPYESFSHENHLLPWTPSPHGAFVYLFNEDHSPNASDCYFPVADNCLGVAPSD